MARNVLLHCNNWAVHGGIEQTVLDMRATLPMYEHVLATIQDGREDLGFVRHVQDRGVRYVNLGGKVTRAAVEEIAPAVLFLHNTQGKDVEGEWPYGWLNEARRVVGVHHAMTKPLFWADLDWFVSDWVRKPYAKCEGRMDGKAMTMPPCVCEEPFLKVRRPKRTPVVGRVQSETRLRHGKLDGFFGLLEKVERCGFFVVSRPEYLEEIKTRERFRSAEIRPGATPEFLREIDVFAVWGETTETWSRVVTEANLSGIPVVARDHGDGLAEQLGKSGGGVLVRTEAEFVEAVQAFVDDESLRAVYAEAGREWCLENASSRTLREKLVPWLLEWSLT